MSGAPILNWTGADVDTVLQTIPSKSKSWLRVTITLNPSTDKFNAPVLDANDLTDGASSIGEWLLEWLVGDEQHRLAKA